MPQAVLGQGRHHLRGRPSAGQVASRLWLIANCKNGISSYELARALGVTQKTAWFMLHRIRLAMQTRTFGKLTGDVEVDETYIGGKARNMHASERKRIGITQARQHGWQGRRHGPAGAPRQGRAQQVRHGDRLPTANGKTLQRRVRAARRSPARPSTPTRCQSYTVSTTTTSTTSSTTPRLRGRRKSTPTDWRTSGAC